MFFHWKPVENHRFSMFLSLRYVEIIPLRDVATVSRSAVLLVVAGSKCPAAGPARQWGVPDGLGETIELKQPRLTCRRWPLDKTCVDAEKKHEKQQKSMEKELSNTFEHWCAKMGYIHRCDPILHWLFDIFVLKCLPPLKYFKMAPIQILGG